MKIYKFLLILIIALLVFGCIGTNNINDKINNRQNKTNFTSQVNATELVNPDKLKERPISEILECQKENSKREQERCYDNFIKDKMNFKTTKELLQEMDEAANNNDNLRLSCHDFAHAIGRNTYRKFNNSIPAAFSQCVQTCHAGCYHGAIQSFFLGDNYQQQSDDHVTLVQMREKVKLACKPLEGNVKELFQCLHGMGHAILYYVDNNLTLALSICDELKTDYQRQSCYGGEFMENVVSVNKETRQIKLDSPLYPCNSLEEKYKYQCYLMQTSVMMEIFGDNTDKMVESCDKADNGYIETCFKSLGRDRSNHFRIKNDLPFQDIKKIDKKYKMDYVSGLIYALLDNTWNGYYAFPFCSKLDDKDLKDNCYRTAINYLSLNLDTSKEDIKKSCEEHTPSEDKNYCLERV